MAPSTLYHSFSSRITVLFQEVFFQTAGVYADADGQSSSFYFLQYLFHSFATANITGINSNFVCSCIHGK